MRTGYWWGIAEPAGVFALIMVYIWRLRHTHHGFWIAILAVLVLSHVLRRENAEQLGFVRRNLVQCLREYMPALLFVSLVLLSAGIVLATTRPISFDQGLMALMGYLPWGLAQQYMLNGYFVNRLQAAVPRAAPLAAASLFAGAHLPNWFLMAVTFLAGYVCARIYSRHKNLFFLGLAHATVGFLLYLVVPDWLSHHLVIGPGWFSR